MENKTPPTKPLISILAISFLVLIGLFLFIYWPRPEAMHKVPGIDWIPTVNALFNSLSSILIVGGVVAVKKKQISLHKQLMGLATLCSGFFLVGYLTYHYFHGNVLFQGIGWIRTLYFSILISHIALTVLVLPGILVTLYMALSERLKIHRKVATFTYPIWLYVNITGVLIYLMR